MAHLLQREATTSGAACTSDRSPRHLQQQRKEANVAASTQVSRGPLEPRRRRRCGEGLDGGIRLEDEVVATGALLEVLDELLHIPEVVPHALVDLALVPQAVDVRAHALRAVL